MRKRRTALKSHRKKFLADTQRKLLRGMILFGAFLGDKMVAGVVNFICTKDVVLAFYISHDEKYQETRALNLLFYSIFDWAITNNFKVFDFGIFTVNEEPNFGLARFKENFGASGMFRDTFEIIL